jgi:uncharacterized protein (DUF983 family)
MNSPCPRCRDRRRYRTVLWVRCLNCGAVLAAIDEDDNDV